MRRGACIQGTGFERWISVASRGNSTMARRVGEGRETPRAPQSRERAAVLPRANDIARQGGTDVALAHSASKRSDARRQAPRNARTASVSHSEDAAAVRRHRSAGHGTPGGAKDMAKRNEAQALRAQPPAA